MGGLWVDYNSMSNVPGLFVLGEANFSDHGANRLGASALMQGLADGYFVLPYTIGELSRVGSKPAEPPTTAMRNSRSAESVEASTASSSSAIKGKRTVDEFHRELGKMMWEKCGMARNDAGFRKRSR